MAKLCRCGKICEDTFGADGHGPCKCRLGNSTQRRDTTAEGHGADHRRASERHRLEHPLCERCVMLYGAIDAKPSKDMHHIHSISSAPHLRMDPSNWLAVCGPCHEAIEGRELEGMEIKAWSMRAYYEAMEACSVPN